MNRDTRIANLEARRAMASDSANWIAYVDKLAECLSASDPTIRERLENELDQMPAPRFAAPRRGESNASAMDDLAAAIARGAVGHAARRGGARPEENEAGSALDSLDTAEEPSN